MSDPGKSKADDRLSGNWQLRNDDGSVNDYRFAPAGGKLPASVMRVAGSSRKPDGTTEQLASLLLFPSTIGDKTYLNVTDGTEPKVKLLEEQGWTAETVNTYLIVAGVLLVAGFIVGLVFFIFFLVKTLTPQTFELMRAKLPAGLAGA
ncbi:MAG: hypothetical protein NTY19_16590 [Planctomycetota bacterium]|nr:hypothetical protein [Planctomycetota bacterium]